MKIKKAFVISGICAALGLGVFAGFASYRNSYTNVKEAKADVEPNDIFDHIYNDSYNNATYSTGFNRVLLCYTGTAHGLPSDTVLDDAATLSNILFDDIPLSSLPGSKIVVWGGQNWFNVIYPKTSEKGSTFEVLAGLTVGDSICDHAKFTMNENGVWRRTFVDAVNASYASIYSDDFNNGTHATGYNRLMFKYTGTAHGVTTAIAGASPLMNYDNYIFIDDAPLSTYAGGSTQIAPWNGQPWIQIIYPTTAISVGSTLVIKEGCKIGAAVFEKIAFKLNSSEKWEKINHIADDMLVEHSDYKLFTLSDYPFATNSSFIFYAGSEFVDAMSDSFGFRCIVNIPVGQAASTHVNFNFACTDIYGNNPIVKVIINYGSNAYLNFNGSIDWSTNLSPVWAEGVDHLVEIYMIKTSATTCRVLLGVDEELVWKSAEHDITGLTFHNYFTATGGDTGSYYSAATDNTALALERFGEIKLKSNDVLFSNNADTGACKGAEGYYAKAKTFYNSFLTSNQKQAFANQSTYANLRARMIAWGAANGETISFNPSTGALEVSASNRLVAISPRDGVAIVVIISISFIIMLTAAGVFYIRRRKEN